MIVPLRELALVGALGLAFSALGALCLRPRSPGLFAWSQSFLAGGALCSALLFPLSLLAPGKALVLVAMLLAAASLTWLGARLRSGRIARPRTDPDAGFRRDPVSMLLVLALLAAILAFAALDLRHPLWWDGFQIWASKAQRLFYEGSLGRDWYAGDTYDRRLLTYPPLVPLFESLVALLRGGFAFDVFKPVFLPFYVSLLVSTFAAARSRLPARAALLAALLVAMVPALSTRVAAGGYADMPLAAVVAAVAAAALRDDGARGLPWMIGALTVVKNEGLVLAAIAVAAVAVSWLVPEPRRFLGRLRAHAGGIAVVTGFAAARLAYLAWLRVDDPSFRGLASAGNIPQALRRLPDVLRLCLESALRPRVWGVLWPAFLIAGIYVLFRGDRPERALAAAVAAAGTAWVGIFLQTTWPLELHVAQAFPRLLAQIAPAAILTVLFAAARALGVVSSRAAR